MKLIKHLINIMFLWSIPFILLGFFNLLTWGSFAYLDAVTSAVWIAVMFFYCLGTFLMYTCNDGSIDDIYIIKP